VVPEDGWIVLGVFSDNRMDFDGVTKASWEIRKDMLPRSGGIVVASGVSPATQTAIPGNGPFPCDLLIGCRIQVNGLGVPLAPSVLVERSSTGQRHIVRQRDTRPQRSGQSRGGQWHGALRFIPPQFPVRTGGIGEQGRTVRDR
jgi:hypothetical protein